MKKGVPKGGSIFFFLPEGGTTFQAAKVAASADVFINNHADSGYKHKQYDDRQANASSRVTAKTNYSQAAVISENSQTMATRDSNKKGEFSRKKFDKPRACYICGSENHLKFQCDQRKALASSCVASETKPNAATAEAEVSLDAAAKQETGAARKKNSGKTKASIAATKIAAGEKHATSAVRVMPLQFMQLYINGQSVKTLIDSGSQVAILKETILQGTDIKSVGTIQVQGIFGEAQTANIVPVDVRLCNEDAETNGVALVGQPTQIVCAVVPNMAASHDMILPAKLAEEIMQSPLFERLSDNTREPAKAEYVDCENTDTVEDENDNWEHVDIDKDSA